MSELTIKDLETSTNYTIESFNASLLSHKESENELELYTYRYGRMPKTGYAWSRESDASLEIELLFNDTDIEAIKEDASTVRRILKHCQLTLDCIDDKYYEGYLAEIGEHEFINEQTAIYRFTLLVSKWSTATTQTVTSGSTVTIEGAMETPLNITLTASGALTHPTIKVGDVTFTFASLASGDVLVINSMDGLITCNGSLYSADASFTEFPQYVGDVTFTFTNISSSTVTLTYSKRWL